ncbi:MAG: DUF11 domain-containing protein [Caldilineaceae bacterium]|nr:DUF11 domain-containing protein [Caldilineaceae bacterium]
MDKFANPSPVAAGARLTYTLVVTNSGPTIAYNVVVTDALPTMAKFVQASAGCALGVNNLLTCNPVNVDVGTVLSYTVVVTSDVAGVLTNVAGVKSATPDPGQFANLVSLNTTVASGAYVKLQLLAPGETAAPGTSSGKSGVPSAQTAGIPFTMSVNAVDAFWNVVPDIANQVSMTTTDFLADVPANQALIGGTANLSVTLRLAGSTIVTATDVTDGSKTPGVIPLIVVNVGDKAQLTFGQQPSVTATAGVAFATQPVVYIEDSSGNLVPTASDSVTLTAFSDASCTTPAATALNNGGPVGASGGVASFSGVNYETAETIYLKATSGALAAACSNAVAVGPAAKTKLVFTQQPSIAATAGLTLTIQPVVEIQDQFGNRTTDNDSVTLTAFTDSACTIPASGTLNNGGPLAATAGQASFSGLNYEKAETVYLKAASGSLTACMQLSHRRDAGSLCQAPDRRAGRDGCARHAGWQEWYT